MASRLNSWLAPVTSMTAEVVSPLPAMAAGAKALTNVSRKVISDAHFLDDAQFEDETRDIATLLGSLNNSQKLEGLKRLIACMSVGRDMSEFFPKVVVNVANTPFEVKNLVYIFLVRYAEKKPDEALLSINSFQKDLSDSNPRIRALALRVMSSIRIHVTVPIVILAIKKCALDPSVYVRKAAAHAIPKVFRLDRSVSDQVVEVIELLLNDRTPFVIGSAVAALLAVCPERLDLLHPQFRKLCRMIVDIDEWGQAQLAGLLLRYARTQFCKPDNTAREINDNTEAQTASEDGSSKPGTSENAVTAASFKSMLARNKGFYDDEEEGKEDEDGSAEDEEEEEGVEEKKSKKVKKKGGDDAKAEPGNGPLDEDLILLLRCTRPLMQSRNAAVVMGVASLHVYLAPVAELPKVAAALVFAMRTSSPEAQQVLIANIASIVAVMPNLFAPHMSFFYVKATDSFTVRNLKLEILTSLATSENSNALLQELQVYLRDPDKRFLVSTVRALGRCAARIPSTSTACVRSLVALTMLADEQVSAEAVIVIRTLVQQQPKAHGAVVLRMVKSLDQIQPPLARAAVVWMAGGDFGQGPETITVLQDTHAKKLELLAPEVLRRVAASFSDETNATKLQLLNSVSKLRLRQPENEQILALHGYVLTLARYDRDYDVRDRARYLRLLVPPAGEESEPSALAAHANAILFCPKPLPPLPALSPARGAFTLATLSHMVQHSAPGYFGLAPHPLVPPPSSVRNPPVERKSDLSKKKGKNAEPVAKGLDGFYNSDQDESYTSEEDDDDDEDSDEESEDEEEDSDEEESEEDDEEDEEDDEDDEDEEDEEEDDEDAEEEEEGEEEGEDEEDGEEETVEVEIPPVATPEQGNENAAAEEENANLPAAESAAEEQTDVA